MEDAEADLVEEKIVDKDELNKITKQDLWAEIIQYLLIYN